MQLPQFKSDDLTLQLLQSKWASILNPLIASPLSNASILKRVSLQIGSNSIPHLLGRPLQGWSLVRKRGSADIYDEQDSNQMPQFTLKLNSDTEVVVDIVVF